MSAELLNETSSHLRNVTKYANLTTITNGTEWMWPQWWKEPEEVQIARLCIEGLILFLGATGNAAVCWVLVRRLGIKTIMDAYILSLALADLGVVALLCPLAMIRAEYMPVWPLGEWTCTVLLPVCDVFLGASAWSITAIAIDRLRHINNKIGLYQPISTKNKLVRVLCIWIMSFAFTSVVPLFVLEFDAETKSCHVAWPDVPYGTSISKMQEAYSVTLAVFWYILPLIIIGFSYVAVWKTLKKAQRFRKRQSNTRTENTRFEMMLRQSAKARRILTPLVVIFAVTLFPVTAIRLMWTYWLEGFYFKYYVVFFDVARLLTAINSATNPIVYSLVRKDIREELKKYSYSFLMF